MLDIFTIGLDVQCFQSSFLQIPSCSKVKESPIYVQRHQHTLYMASIGLTRTMPNKGLLCCFSAGVTCLPPGHIRFCTRFPSVYCRNLPETTIKTCQEHPPPLYELFSPISSNDESTRACEFTCTVACRQQEEKREGCRIL